jgi:DNA-binding CsgD family transcriptional regulator
VSHAQHVRNCHEDLRFSDRELGILRHIAAGATNEEAAARLNLSAHTVAGHLRVMLGRSQARNRAELVARAYAGGILVAGVWPPTLSGRRCLQVPSEL